MKTSIEGEYFCINYRPTRSGLQLKINERLSEIPLDTLKLRSTPYFVTDKATKIQYQITTSIQGNISINLKKKDIQKYNIGEMISSLEKKLDAQFGYIVTFLYNAKTFFEEYQNKIITSIEYAPTDLVFSMQFGQIMNCQFFLSHLIGNQLMDGNDRFLKFMILKPDIVQGDPSQIEQFKSPPINLCLLIQQKTINDFMDLLHRTYIPIQILNYKLNEFILSTFQHFICFIPTKAFGIFQFCYKFNKQNYAYFRHDLNSFVIQIHSRFIQDKLYFEFESAQTYIEEHEICGVYNLNTFRDDYYKIFQKKLLSTIQEIEEFIFNFLQFSLMYFFFQSKKDLMIQLMKIHSFSQFNNRMFQALISRAGNQLSTYVMRICRGEQVTDAQKKGYPDKQKNLVNVYIDRLLYSIYYIQIEEKDYLVNQFLREYIDKLDKIVAFTIKSQDLKHQEELLQKLQTLWFQIDDNIFSIYINHQSQIIQYKIQGNLYQKICNDEGTQNFTAEEFYQTQHKFMRAYFPDLKQN